MVYENPLTLQRYEIKLILLQIVISLYFEFSIGQRGLLIDQRFRANRRVDRVLGFFTQSSELGLPRRLMCSPPFRSGGTHLLAGEGVGGPNSDLGTDTVVL